VLRFWGKYTGTTEGLILAEARQADRQQAAPAGEQDFSLVFIVSIL